MVSACLRRIRAHKYISHVRREFGDVGASIVEAFFLYGRMSKDALVKDIMPLLEAEAVSLGKDGKGSFFDFTMSCTLACFELSTNSLFENIFILGSILVPSWFHLGSIPSPPAAPPLPRLWISFL